MPSAPVPIGATTGMKPPPSSARITAGSIESISPTWPRSTWLLSLEGSSILRARMKAPSWPVSPTALPPAWLMGSTTSLLTWPPSTARLCLSCNCRLLDRDLLALGCGFLRQRELQHALAELGLRLGLVDFLRQRKAAAHLAVDALAVQHALVLGRFLLALDLGL